MNGDDSLYMYSKAALDAANSELKASENTSKTLGNDNDDDISVLDNADLSALISQCEQVEQEEEDMEAALRSFLRKLQAKKESYKPWRKIQMLTKTSLTLSREKQELEKRLAMKDTEISSLSLMNEKLTFRLNNDESSTKNDKHDLIVEDLRKLVAQQSEELASLRNQRNLLHEQLDKERNENEMHISNTNEMKNTNDALKFELSKWKNITESKIAEISTKFRDTREDLDSQKKQNEELKQQIQELISKNDQLVDKASHWEHQSSLFQSQLESTNINTNFMERSSQVAKSTIEQLEKELAGAREERETLMKKCKILSEENNEMRQSLSEMDKVRLATFKEYEQKLDASLAQYEKVRASEMKLRADITDMKENFRTQSDNYEYELAKANERINAQNDTIANLMNNIKMLGISNAENKEPEDSKHVFEYESHYLHDTLEDPGFETIDNAMANDIRKELERLDLEGYADMTTASHATTSTEVIAIPKKNNPASRKSKGKSNKSSSKNPYQSKPVKLPNI